MMKNDLEQNVLKYQTVETSENFTVKDFKLANDHKV